jgi:copper chaperone NosL
MILVNRNYGTAKGGSAWKESLLLVLAGIALLGSLFFPIWRITLDAPQYPEGMGMQIWARTIVGENANDLEIINQLNHYIGMKKIVPESIPELRFIMPLIVAFASLSFLLALRPRAWSTGLLLLGLSGLGAFGMYDFWLWEYDYGHDLNPMAAIKVPGMSYQPPLIGEAMLLNFLSTSWPAAGGYLLFLGGGLIASSLFLSLWGAYGPKIAAGRSRAAHASVALAIACLVFQGCGKSGPVPFFWGEDACHHCKMTLVQKGFAAQRINDKGKVYKYDAIECLLEDLKAKPVRVGEGLFVSDWSRPDAMVSEAQSVFFLKGGDITSPMGSALAAFQSRDSATAFQARVGGDLLDWSGLKNL